ncbi:hypothetical protein [Staphylococcus shinii]|uniref:hypothetical protein n=1 Tax=Staphylococcus shinii TaxID=2912228 RepID=UPI003D80541E
MSSYESDKKIYLPFLLTKTNILQINYDRKTNLTYIYIVENEGRLNADLVVYEFDINDVMNFSEDSIGSVEDLLEEFFFKNYETLERISKLTKIGRFNNDQFKKFLSFNSVYGLHSMTDVSKKIYENCIERLMVRIDDFNGDYLYNVVESIEKDNGFNKDNETVDIDVIEKNTVFKKVNRDEFKSNLDERMILSNHFIDNLLMHEEEEIYISYKYLCEILFKVMNDIIMTEN